MGLIHPENAHYLSKLIAPIKDPNHRHQALREKGDNFKVFEQMAGKCKIKPCGKIHEDQMRSQTRLEEILCFIDFVIDELNTGYGAGSDWTDSQSDEDGRHSTDRYSAW